MGIVLREVDQVQIITLQDNYIDLTDRAQSDIVHRAMPLKGMELSNSILAEHGFSALLRVSAGDASHSILFDFGFSEHGAATNVDNLNLDLSEVETLVLSHGHVDHTGGFQAMVEKVGRPGIELICHPGVFRRPRYARFSEEMNVTVNSFTTEMVEKAGVTRSETVPPVALADNTLAFLGEIPRHTEYEKSMPNAFYQENGEEKWDDLSDDSALVAHVKGKGLVVLSGCAHSGIINTVKYARAVTGVNDVFVVMGGFHLTGPHFEPAISPTIEAFKEINPRYLVPTHCTGHTATACMEREMPEQFILNMAGTTLTFAA